MFIKGDDAVSAVGWLPSQHCRNTGVLKRSAVSSRLGRQPRNDGSEMSTSDLHSLLLK